jgi:hypothetical protein
MLRLDHEGRFEIDQHEVGGRALGEASAVQPEQARRVRRYRLQKSGKIDAAIMVKAERGGKQRLEPDGAVGSLGEGAPLHVRVLGVVGRDDHVDIAAPRI